MPDILGATNPVPGHDRTTVNRNIPLPNANEHIQNVPDPQRVSRPDGRGGQQENTATSEDRIRYDSHFQLFMKRLRETPDAAECLRRIFSGSSISVSSGIREGTATELGALLAGLRIEEADLLSFLSGQLKTGSQLGGALFAMLRSACARGGSEAVQDGVLRFVRAWLDYSSAPHIQGNILRGLDQMSRAMPASWGERLQQLTRQLEQLMAGGSHQESVQFLQKDVLSLISQYISRSHDLGLPRQLTNQLTLNMARYENGTTENLLAAFGQLKSFGTLRQQLGGIDDQSLLAILQRDHARSGAQATRFADLLADRAAQALRGTGSLETQQAFQELVRSILINESVYMPLNHYLLPLEADGRMLFSELWVDPNADQDQDGRSRSDQGREMRFLFKMDIQGVGLVDLVLVHRDGQVSLRLDCPRQLTSFSDMIEHDLAGILKENELTPAQISVRQMGRPLTLTEVFPKIFERKDSINVKI